MATLPDVDNLQPAASGRSGREIAPARGLPQQQLAAPSEERRMVERWIAAGSLSSGKVSSSREIGEAVYATRMTVGSGSAGRPLSARSTRLRPRFFARYSA